jgi:hypothetical protein
LLRYSHTGVRMARFLVGVAVGAALAGGVFVISRHRYTKIPECQAHVYGKWHINGKIGQYPVQVRECRACGYSELRPVIPPL